jgi:transposase
MQHGVIAGGCFPAVSNPTGLGLALAKRRAAMEQYVGLDISLKETSLCVVDQTGTTLWQGKCASTPEGIAAVLTRRAPGATRIGLESGLLSTWHWHALKALDLPVVCLDARGARAFVERN